jgi:hypothetical protein
VNTPSPSTLSPSLQRSLSLLENFARDIKFTLSTIVNSPSCPQFPLSEWTNLVSGRTVDLDHVLSGLFSLTGDTKRTQRIGDIEISTGSGTPAQKVSTHGEWTIAWDSAADATLFIFRHRDAELKRYHKYITGLFAAIPQEQHKRIIALEISLDRDADVQWRE